MWRTFQGLETGNKGQSSLQREEAFFGEPGCQQCAPRERTLVLLPQLCVCVCVCAAWDEVTCAATALSVGLGFGRMGHST